MTTSTELPQCLDAARTPGPALPAPWLNWQHYLFCMRTSC